MTIEDALEAVKPLLHKFASWHVPGFDYDDLYSELSVRVWYCHQTYDASKGSVINMLTLAFKRRLGNLRNVSRKQVQPIARLVCPGCGGTRRHDGTRVRPDCAAGCVDMAGRGLRMVDQRESGGLFSLEARQEDTAFDLPDHTVLGADDPVEDLAWREGLSRSDVRLVEACLEGRALSEDRRARLEEIYPRLALHFGQELELTPDGE